MRFARPAPPGRWPAGLVATAALLAGMLLLWPGALLQVVVIQAVLVVQVLLQREPAAAALRARSLAGLHGLAALLLAPFCLGQAWEQYGTLSPLVLSSFQPLWLGSGALTLALLGSLWTRPALAATQPRRTVTALLLAAVGVTSAWVALPGLREAVGGAAGWFQVDPFLAVVAEIRPLLFAGGVFDPGAAHKLFSYLFWAYPFAAVWLMWEAARRGRADVALLVLWSSAFFGTAALAQRRFNDCGSVAFALVVGCALAEGFRGLSGRLAPSQRVAAAGALGALLIAASGPCAFDRAAQVEASVAARRSPGRFVDPIVRQRRVLQRVAHFLRSESPPTRGYLDPSLSPEYGVLSAWGNGHLLRYYGERPMVQDNFGPYCGRRGFDLARIYFASRSESEAMWIVQQLRARYVVATAQGSGQTRITPGSMAARLLPMRNGDGTLSFRGPLAQHRLVFLADDTDLGGESGEIAWSASVFEIVRGAFVTGRAPADTLIGFELSLGLADGTQLRYAASARADERGRYEIRLPYPTDGTSGAAVRSDGRYAVGSAGRTLELAVSESDVHDGAAIEGPSFEP